MTQPTAVSKPLAVPALRSTWRASAQHYREQITRFLRIFVATLAPQLIQQFMTSNGHLPHVDRAFVIAFVVPALEVAWRQFRPALGAAGADAAPGVTIVPDQVGLQADAVTPPASDAPSDPSQALPVPPQAGPVPAPLDLNDVPQDITP